MPMIWFMDDKIMKQWEKVSEGEEKITWKK